ncbi:MAG: hypothetical protein GF350_15095, partial [Chitinivibrionales bacterium]|nr:hypothetical protein [Chitinivibrionales bacterium]
MLRPLVSILVISSFSFSATVYVSPDGNDSGDGSESAPFKTLHKARDALRESGDAQKKVIIKGGIYFLDEKLVLDERDGGTADNPVVWQGADGEWPVIYGGKRITGWELWQGNIYRAKLADNGITDFDTTMWTLSENGYRAKPARHPNRDQNPRAAYSSSNSGGETAYYEEGQFPEP